MVGGALSFILWSITEPAVGLICSCLPVLRPLFTGGLIKLGSSHGRSWYTSKRSKSNEYSGGSSKRDQKKSNMTGTYEEMQTPLSSFDKPLPPAYSPLQEKDTGYHTWSWNALSRPRHENNSPKLTRSPRERDVPALGRSPSFPSPENRPFGQGLSSPSRLKTNSPILDKSPKPSSPSDNLDSPCRTIENSSS